MQTRLSESFFNRHVAEVAQDLLGKTLVYGSQLGIITETEAYRGIDDAASHAFKGPTPRCKVMFGPAGFTYVYFVYGMYYCLNIVTEPEGVPSAVLLRGLRLVDPPYTHLNGPGKLCKYLGINTSHNGINLVTDDAFYVLDGNPIKDFKVTPRIGITKNVDKLWRFVMV